MTGSDIGGPEGSGSQAGDAGRGDVGAPDVRVDPSADAVSGSPGEPADVLVGEGDPTADDLDDDPPA